MDSMMTMYGNKQRRIHIFPCSEALAAYIRHWYIKLPIWVPVSLVLCGHLAELKIQDYS
jgi:hypothetical protein